MLVVNRFKSFSFFAFLFFLLIIPSVFSAVTVFNSENYRATLAYPRWKMWVNPSNPSELWLLLADNRDQLWRSVDGGLSWNAFSDTSSNTYGSPYAGQITPYLDYHASLYGDSSGNLFVTAPYSSSDVGFSIVSSPASSSNDIGPFTLIDTDSGIRKRSNVVANDQYFWVFTRTSGNSVGNVRYFWYDKSGSLLGSGWVVNSGLSDVRIGSTLYHGNPLVVVWNTGNSFTYYLWSGSSFTEPPDSVIWSYSGGSDGCSNSGLTREYSFAVVGDELHLVWSCNSDRVRHAWKNLVSGSSWSYDDVVVHPEQYSYHFTPLLTVHGSDLYVFFVLDQNNVQGSGDVYYSLWNRSSLSWSSPVRLSFDGNDNHMPNTAPVVPASADYLPVVWTNAAGDIIFERASLLSSGSPPSSVCGNGVVESGEGCDDGNTVTESCSYGLTSCQVCDSSCQLVSGSTSFCGDSFCDSSFEDSSSCSQDCSPSSVCGNGVVETGEDCDDGNTMTETCSYGLTSCQVCDSSCHLVSGSTSFCGDSFCDNAFEDSNSCPQDCSSGSFVPVYSCGVLDQPDTTYVLMNDVVADDSCFLIAADNVVLDLNSHTVTYANNPSTVSGCSTYNGVQSGPFCHFGVVGRGNPGYSMDFPGYNDWSRAENVVVKNGFIVQSPNSGRFSDGIRGGGLYWTIDNVSITLRIIDSKGIQGGNYWTVKNSNITGVNIQGCVENRHMGVPGVDLGHHALVDNNVLVGVPHAGIRVDDDSVISNNYISQDQRGDNAFGIWFISVDNSVIYNNVINTTNGRGILFDSSSNNVVYNNYIETYENKWGDPCSNYPTSGTYSLRLRYNTRSNHIYNNTVIAHAYGGEGGRGVALVLTNTHVDLYNIIENNTFIATSDGSAEADALVFEYNDEDTFPRHIIRNNRFISDDIIVSFYGNNGKGANLVSFNDSFEKGPNPTPSFALFYFNPQEWNDPINYNINGNLFINPSFVNTDYSDIVYSSRCSSYDCEFSVLWTVTVRVVDAGVPVQGASVRILDSQGSEVFNGLTDSGGVVSVNLTQFVENGGSRTYFTPHEVFVSYNSFSAQSQLVVDSPGKSLLFDVSGAPSSDLNSDGVVDLLDLSLFSKAFGLSDLSVDFNSDGVVDFADFLLFENSY